MNAYMQNIYKEIKTTHEELVKYIRVMETIGGVISDEYIERIAEHIADDVAEEIHETADSDWSDGDLRLAIGRVLCNRLGIEY